MRVVFESAWPATVALLVFGCTGTVGDASSETTGTETSNSSTITMGSIGSIATTDSISVTDGCLVGAESCPCTLGGGCDPGLVCVDDVCVSDGGGTDATDVSSTMSTTDATTATEETTDPSTSSSDSGSSSESGAPADLDPWTKRRPILIGNTNDEPLEDHEVLLVLDWDDDMNADLSDLRFTDESGTELLPHWLESSVAPVDFHVWVRVPQIDAMDVATIYMWYGEPNAEDVSDPSAVFHFWDGFDGDDLSATWSANDEYDVANGRLSLTSGTVFTVAPLIEAPGWVVEARMRWPALDNVDSPSGLTIAGAQGDGLDIPYVRLMRDINGYVGEGYIEGQAQAFYQVLNPWVQHPPAQFEWIRVGNNADTMRAATQHEPVQIDSLDHPGMLEADLYVRLGNANGSNGMPGPSIIDIEVDAVLVRRFELELPEVFAGGEEDV